jgi:hypothetical protein
MPVLLLPNPWARLLPMGPTSSDGTRTHGPGIAVQGARKP